MFELYLYNNKAENNRVDKSTFITLLETLYGTLREECSVISPSILIESIDPINVVVDDLRPNSESGFVEYVVDDTDGLIMTDTTAINIMKCNYVYIPQFNRYYYINNIVSIRTGLWRLDMSCDVLMSFKDKILDLDAYIGRQEFNFNPLLPDSKCPVKQNNIFEMQVHSMGNIITNDNFSNGNFIISFMSNTDLQDDLVNGCNIYVVDYQILQKIFNIIYSSSFNNENIDYIIEPSQCIVNLMYVPLNFGKIQIDSNGKFSLTTTRTLKILNQSYNIDGAGYMAYVSNYHSCKINAFNVTISNKYNNFADYEPYSNISIYIPFIGSVDLIPSRVVGKELRFTYYVNVYDGSCMCVVKEYLSGYIIGKYKGQIGVVLPITRDNNIERGMLQAIADLQYDINERNVSTKLISGSLRNFGNVANGAMSSAGSFNTLGVIGSGVKGGFEESALIYEAFMGAQNNTDILTIDSMNASVVKASIGESGGALLDFIELSNVYILYTYPNIDNKYYDNKYAHMVGKPSSYVGKLKLLNGYTEVIGIHLENIENATSQELSVIESYLRNGVLLPDKTE